MRFKPDLSGIEEQFHEELLNRYEWFLHVTPPDNLNSIIESGLVPRNPDMPEEVGQSEGVERPIICMHPLGSKIFPRPTSGGVTGRPLVTLAVRGEYLPGRAGIDWSYSSTEDVFEPSGKMLKDCVKHVHEFGSIAIFENIDPEHIRIFCAGDPPGGPAFWGKLTDSATFVLHYPHDSGCKTPEKWAEIFSEFR